MCRYAYSGPYKRHFVCFDCRKAFKQPPIDDFFEARGRSYLYRELASHWADAAKLADKEREFGVQLADLQAEFHAAERKCPECGGLMADLGLDLKTPRQNDARAWKKLQGMYRVGHEWRSCGCDGPGWIPVSTSDMRQYLTARLQIFKKRLLHTEELPAENNAAKHAEATFWATRIDDIEAELAALD
jgi:hypothetical protein